jgi:hypothetical protein
MIVDQETIKYYIVTMAFMVVAAIIILDKYEE